MWAAAMPPAQREGDDAVPLLRRPPVGVAVAAVPADGRLNIELDAALQRGRRRCAEVEINISTLSARERVLVIVRGRVGTGAGGQAGLTAAGWATLAAHQVHAGGLEGAAGGCAVDVGDVVPDAAAGERVLELGDWVWVAAGFRLGELQ